MKSHVTIASHIRKSKRYLFSWHWCLIVGFLLSLQRLSLSQTYDDIRKGEEYCRNVRNYAEGNKGITRFFFKSSDQPNKSWLEQTKTEHTNNLYKHKEYTAAWVSIREGKTLYVALSTLFDISIFGGTDGGTPLLMPNRSLTCEYYFYRNGQLAMVTSTWLRRDESSVKRKKMFDDKGNLLISSTEYNDDSENKFVDKPKEDSLPQIYRRINELPFYNVLQKPGPKK